MSKQVSKCFAYSIKDNSPLFEGEMVLDNTFKKWFSPASMGIMYAETPSNIMSIRNITWFSNQSENIVFIIVISRVGETKIRTDIPRVRLDSWGKSSVKACAYAVQVSEKMESVNGIYAKSYILY
jgi:hypothetical protein